FKEALEPSFKEYAGQIVKNAKALADCLMEKGLRLVSDGTDNHLMLVDVFKSKNLTGKQAEHALELAGIYCNKNTIPFDARTPWDPSGIRLGTPVLTTRGMKEAHMKEVGSFITRALDSANDNAVLASIKLEVKEFCRDFPFYK
ncbi:MAG: serine hydroxymethyltransferase, partial [Candidatus ainarchaeum sp.]|nr:serine hydroxymethyltransferase [Candidatus ainarchaeum sp.]